MAEELEAEIGRAHEMNVALREMVMRHGNNSLIATMEKLVKHTSERIKTNGNHHPNYGSLSHPSGIKRKRDEISEDIAETFPERDS
jgi:N-methylhydantoinase B/oxoprolinase/acetone carboxylase alpha subunit